MPERDPNLKTRVQILEQEVRRLGDLLDAAAEREVRLGRNPQRMYLGKLDAELAAGGSAVVSIWWGTPGLEADSDINVTAYDWLLGAGESLDAATKVVIRYFEHDKVWYVTGAEC